MPPFQGDELYRTQDQILTSMLAAFMAAIPDVWVGEDGNLRILLEVESGQIEGIFLANQLLLENMFIPSANLIALQRHGEQFGVVRKIGTLSSGQLLFTGQGGTYIPIGAEVAYDPGGGQDPLYFITTQDGTIPNPGAASAPVATDAGTGNLAAGTYEWVVTFLTAAGEGLPSDPSNALVLSANRVAAIAIPLGGPGTIGRNVYRSQNGGPFLLVATVNNNTTLTVSPNVALAGTQQPPTADTSTAILLNAQSEETGSEYNAVPGAIRLLANTPDGTTDVTNPLVFVGGSDQEDIDAYRNRILNTLRSPSSGSPIDLETWAEAVDGVESASVFPNDNLGTTAPGHVTVRISGPNGTVPPQSVIDAVAAVLAAQDLANITIHVGTFTPVTLAVTVTIVAATNFVKADLIPTVKLAIEDYVNSIPVGGTAYVSGIIQHVREAVGVADVTVQAPGSNQVAAATSKFVTTDTDVTVN